MKGVIMAGGEGTRLRPLTSVMPKPMVPVMNKPVMEHIINLLKKYDIEDIAVTMCYLPNVITDYFGDGKEYGVNLRYYIEQVPLGTGGSVLNAEDFLNETFVVISGDALTDIDLKRAIEFHREKESKATLVLKRAQIPLEYGIVITDDDGRVKRFLEKPGWGEVFSDTVNTGIYILEPEIFKGYEKGDNFDFSKDLFPKLLKNNIPMYGYVTREYWNDIGDINAYKQTHIDILEKKVNIDFAAKEIAEGIFVGKDTVIPKDIEIEAPAYIGSGCDIENNVSIQAYSVIGNNCTLKGNSKVDRCIIWDNSCIGEHSRCNDSILCNGVITKSNVTIFEGASIGSRCSIEEGATVNTNIKIWPNKHIKANTIVSRNLIWKNRMTKNLFGNRGISGEVNVDITPELGSILGSAYGSTLKKDSTVIVASDGEKSSVMIKECIISGLVTTGCNVVSMDSVIAPIARFGVRFYKSQGGVYVSLDHSKKNNLRIEIFNNKGGNIDKKLEKKIETLFFREDFKRINNGVIGDISKAEKFSSIYIQKNLSLVTNKGDIKARNTKIIVTSASLKVAEIAGSYLKKLGCQVQNAFPLTRGNDFLEYIDFTKEVLNSGSYDMGIILSDNGEDFIIVNNKSGILWHEKLTLLKVLVALKSGICKNIVVTDTASKQVEKLAEKYGAKVIRTKSSISDRMNELLFSQNSYTTEDKDEFMFQYHLSFDGIVGIGRIISFLVSNNLTLEELIEEIPELYMKKSEISCEFTERGRVISEFIKQRGSMDDLTEGIKISNENGWAIILPDFEKPVFNIFSEGYSEEYAEEISRDAEDMLSKIINSK